MAYFKNPTILKILDYYKDLWSLSYLSGLAHWDLETYMPKMATNFRGEAMARVSTIHQKLFLQKDFTSLLSTAGKLQPKFNDYEKGVVRVLNRTLKFYQKVPSTFLENFEKLTNKATVVWSEAKKNNDFKKFEPYLKKIFDQNRKLADYLGYTDSPYDALLDLYEEDLKSKDVAKFFGDVIPQLKELLLKITSSKKYSKSHLLENAKYDKDKMIALNEKILKDLWSDYGKEGNFRLDISSHPFTTSFSKDDTRITTWYHEKDFARSLMAVVHEFGHALYDMQSGKNLEMTPLAGGSSLVLHESQSRLWENHVGRSREFIQKYIRDINNTVHGSLFTVDNVHSYLNQVKPSLLRVEADEVTYHMHIAIRFEIERGLMEGKLKIKDIKEIWNSKMKEYLGVVPTKDSEGVLQDIHWAHGSVGYFPTYSLGTFLGSQFEQQLRVAGYGYKTENIGNIKKWLEKHIHQYGSTYTMPELLKKNKMMYDPDSIGVNPGPIGVDPSVNIKYLEEKYFKIYGFAS